MPRVRKLRTWGEEIDTIKVKFEIQDFGPPNLSEFPIRYMLVAVPFKDGVPRFYQDPSNGDWKPIPADVDAIKAAQEAEREEHRRERSRGEGESHLQEPQEPAPPGPSGSAPPA